MQLSGLQITSLAGSTASEFGKKEKLSTSESLCSQLYYSAFVWSAILSAQV